MSAVEKCGCAGRQCCVHFGLLILRVGIGVLFMIHGIPKILGGVALWEKLGGAMGMLGVNFYPAFWGFMASFSEAAGGLFLILGLLVRPFAALLAFTMIVATVMLLNKQAGFVAASNPAHMIVVFLALLIMGGGDFCLSRKIKCLREHWYQ